MEAVWTKVSRDAIDKPKKARFQGVDIEIHVSPYDLPEKFRWYSQGESILVVEFSYLGGDEQLKSISGGDDTTIYLGKTSQRIYKIELGLAHWKIQAADIRVRMAVDAIGTLENDPTRNFRKGNYEAAAEVLQEYISQVPA